MRRQVDLVAAELRTKLVDDRKVAHIVAAVGTEQHVQIADALGAPQVIQAVPEKFRPSPTGNDQYVAVLDQRICHGASVDTQVPRPENTAMSADKIVICTIVPARFRRASSW